MIRIKVFTAIVSWLLLATMVSGCVGSSPAAITRTVVSETLVAQIGILPSGSLAYSPDARRVAYVADIGGEKYVVVDGVPGQKSYDAFETPGVSSIGYGTFSPDSKRVAYVAITYGEKPPAGNKYFVVINGEEGNAYSTASSVTFSPDSKHVAYVADGLVFLDGVPVKGPEGIPRSNPLFSPDSQHLAFVVEQSGGGKSVVLDGVLGKPYGLIGAIAFSPDSQHLAYRAMTTNVRWVMVADGKEKAQYESNEWHLQDIVFSPDSRHLAYVAGENYRSPEHRQFVVLDGKELTRHKDSLDWGIVFSPDGNRLAYGGGSFIVIDGVEEVVHYNLSMKNFVFSPDSKRHAYKDGKIGWWGNITAEWVVVDGVKGKKYSGVGAITFSPDSKHVAYIVSQGKKAFVIVDETKGKKYDESNISWAGQRYDFSSVGRIVWDSAGRFHYLVQKGNGIYLVEETIGK